jgi:TonB family protein
MPLILVVTKDDRVPGRVREALGPGGWNVAHVHGLTEAMQEVASEAPDLFLVASELDGADNVLTSFARRQGGPGTIAIAPEGAAGPAAARGADAILPRTFDARELREVVERVLRTGDRPARPAEGEPKLTSEDIFGDLVAEVESEAREFPSRPAAAARPEAAAPPPARPVRRADDDIERKLEQTLSGVLGRGAKPKPAPAAPRPPAGPPRGEDDLDKLISDTLSGLELPGARKKRTEPPAPAPPPREGSRPGRPAGGEFDLDDFQALLDRPRRPPRPAAPPAAPAPPPGASAGAEPAAPQPPPPRGELPFQPRFADAMEEVADGPPLEAPAAGEAAGAADLRPPPERPAAPGTEFGQYRLLERIGVGGMAEVWKARMTGVEGFQKTVAIKRILPHLTDSSDFVEMFVDEAKLAAQLNHANIIHIYDLGKLGEDYYIAMEHVEGENLRRILQRARETGRPLPVGLALYVAARLASALDHAHRKRDFDDRELGLVHRDVSPQNVLVGYEGTIKLCDFGIVKAVSKSSHTQRGALKGKLQYMSPEQAWGRPVDGRSDLFSLGALLFEMLTGRRLFVGESEMEVLEAVRECQVAPPSELEPGVPEEVDAVVLGALRSDPEERFQSAGELGRRLEEILAGMRPTPGQGELAAYMAALFDRAPAAPAEAAAPSPAEPAPAAELPAAAGAATVPIPVAKAAAGGPGGPGTGTGAGTGTGLATATGSGAVRAVEPVGKVEPEEGGLRGKWLLVAAILAALLLGGVLAWYFVLGPGAAEDGSGARPPAAREEVEAPGPPVAPPGDGAAEGAAEEGATAAAEDAASAEEEGAADGEALGPEDLPQDIEERLAEREEALRRQFEAELASREQALQERLSELREEPAKEPPPAPAAKAPAPAPAPAPSSAQAPPPSKPAEPEVEEVSAPEESAPPPGDAPAPAPAPVPRPAPPPAPAPRQQPKAPPEPAVREGELVTMGPGVVPPKLVRFEKPEYPPIARRLRAEGEVVISLLVDETGQVTDTRVVQRASQDVGLEEAALEAARSATYQPATKNGVRVKMWTTLRIPFRL